MQDYRRKPDHIHYHIKLINPPFYLFHPSFFPSPMPFPLSTNQTPRITTNKAHLRRDTHDFRHRRYASGINSEKHPRPGHRHTRVSRDLKSVSVAVRAGGCEWYSSLVGVDGMGCGAVSDQRKAPDNAASRRRKRRADLHCTRRSRRDDGAGGESAGGVEVGWVVDLRVVVVCGTGAAETASTDYDGGVGEEEGGGVVGAGDGHGC